MDHRLTSTVLSVFNIPRISKPVLIACAIYIAITPTATANPVQPQTNRSSITPAAFLARNQKVATEGNPAVLAESVKGQTPSLFWLGCSDSRVSETHVVKAAAGEVFVHRNIANVFNPTDTSAVAALAYAINHLKVPHIAVVGHQNCGGCAAALSLAKGPASDSDKDPKSVKPKNSVSVGEQAITRWLEPIRKIAAAVLVTKPAASLVDVVSANVYAQVKNVAEHSIVTEAWARGQAVSVQGWVYDIGTGKLKVQGTTLTGPKKA